MGQAGKVHCRIRALEFLWYMNCRRGRGPEQGAKEQEEEDSTRLRFWTFVPAMPFLSRMISTPQPFWWPLCCHAIATRSAMWFLRFNGLKELKVHAQRGGLLRSLEEIERAHNASTHGGRTTHVHISG